ncbi:hypothetical protein KQI89_16725 [Clostridium sp. MSJ-4]|uniref:Uncharacterized protein n=1 Tax=Clostridium simiarum TaxID=2841506 RepID=A0ABS6F778_9CLOT|nr:hypothetical protein [Clostridium simiarum]
MFDPSDILYSQSYRYKVSKDIMIIFSIIFVLFGLSLKLQKNSIYDLLSVKNIFILLAISSLILLIDHDYIKSLYDMGTPDESIIPSIFVYMAYLLNFPISWFQMVPIVNDNINPCFILISSIYPSFLLFLGMQIRRWFYKE